MKSIFFVAAIALTTLAACQKDDAVTPDTAQVNINVTSPLPGQSYRDGDTVRLKATVSYASEMHGYELRITDSASGSVLYDDAQHVHTDTFNIDEYWIANTGRAGTLGFSLIASIDHDGNVVRKDFNFSLRQ